MVMELTVKVAKSILTVHSQGIRTSSVAVGTPLTQAFAALPLGLRKAFSDQIAALLQSLVVVSFTQAKPAV